MLSSVQKVDPPHIGSVAYNHHQFILYLRSQLSLLGVGFNKSCFKLTRIPCTKTRPPNSVMQSDFVNACHLVGRY